MLPNVVPEVIPGFCTQKCVILITRLNLPKLLEFHLEIRAGTSVPTDKARGLKHSPNFDEIDHVVQRLLHRRHFLGQFDHGGSTSCGQNSKVLGRCLQLITGKLFDLGPHLETMSSDLLQ
jgi:hypothetical protein